MRFYKYEAAGNDFIVVDRCEFSTQDDAAYICRIQEQAPRLCHRHFGIGGDGILVIDRKGVKEGGVARMIIVNADGSLAGMCGNGVRCVGAYLWDEGFVEKDENLGIETDGGMQRVSRRESSMMSVEIGRVNTQREVKIMQSGRLWEGEEIDVGNPHGVFFVQDLSDGALDEALAFSGEFLSNHEIFADRANIEFIREIGDGRIEMRVYERGVGPTLACGTGCVASAHTYARKRGISGRVTVETLGGVLQVEVPALGSQEKYRLIGPVRRVFCGEMEL